MAFAKMTIAGKFMLAKYVSRLKPFLHQDRYTYQLVCASYQKCQFLSEKSDIDFFSCTALSLSLFFLQISRARLNSLQPERRRKKYDGFGLFVSLVGQSVSGLIKGKKQDYVTICLLTTYLRVYPTRRNVYKICYKIPFSFQFIAEGFKAKMSVSAKEVSASSTNNC